MGGGASKKKRRKQKKKRATDPANDEQVPPCDSAILPDVNVPQQKENCQGSPHDDEEKRSPDIKDYENNTEVIPQAGVHQFTRSEREHMGKKITVSHLIEKDEKQPKDSQVKQKSLIMTTGKQVDTISITKPDVHSQHPPVKPMCPTSHKKRHDIEENVLNKDIIPNTVVPPKHSEGNDQPEEGSKSSHHTEKRATTLSTWQQMGKQADASTLNKPDVISQQPTITSIRLSCHKELKVLEANLLNQDTIPDTGVPTKCTRCNQPEDGSKSSNHTETKSTIQGTPQQTGNQDSGQQSPITPMCPPSHKEQNDLEENVLNQDISQNKCVSTKHTAETDQPEDGSKSSHHSETRATIQGTSEQFTETGKRETETHLSEISKPSTHETCAQQETAHPQILEVRNGSTEDAKSPTQQQAPGDTNPNALMIDEKLASTHNNHPITENKTYKLDEAECQATKNSGNTAEPVCGNSGIPPFTLNQRCPNKAHGRHNPGPAPKVRRRFDDCPNYLSEAPWITTTKVAAFVALRRFEDMEKQMED